MKTRVVLGLVLFAALVGCSKEEPASKAAGGAPATADLAAGKAVAERDCKGCHGLDGRGIAPGIPTLAAQRYRYLTAAMEDYRQGRRIHVVLTKIAEGLTEAQEHNVLAYYAAMPPIAAAGRKPTQVFSPYEEGKKLVVECARCHSDDGNSKTPEVPTLAGQQPRYLVTAMQEYLNSERARSPMHPMLRSLNRVQMESVALYFASQTPAPRGAPPFGNPKAGEPLSAVCGGCHGPSGVSVDSATPRLAGQDPRYLVEAIKAYRANRRRESMRIYVGELNEKQIEDIAAFYSTQESRPAESGQTLVQDLTDKCNRCHGPGVNNPNVAFPKINGQDRDYLIMALRAYRDDRRKSSMMHTMSMPYGDAVIESLADYYSSQPLN